MSLIHLLKPIIVRDAAAEQNEAGQANEPPPTTIPTVAAMLRPLSKASDGDEGGAEGAFLHFWRMAVAL